MTIDIITLAILILSVVLHEVAHGYAANWLGDPTARLAGRLSPNPMLHVDPLGSIVVPAFLVLSGSSFLFGWAKPVPYNPYNLTNQRWGEAIVAAAGPLTNVFLALIFAALVRLAPVFSFPHAFTEMLGYVVLINILLAFFNAIPFPPLDGSKVLVALLPWGLAQKYRALGMYMERLGLIGLFLLIFIVMQVIWSPFWLLVWHTYTLLIGS